MSNKTSLKAIYTKRMTLVYTQCMSIKSHHAVTVTTLLLPFGFKYSLCLMNEYSNICLLTHKLFLVKY